MSDDPIELDQLIAPAPGPIELCDRLTATFAMHHEHCGEDPIKAQCTFSDMLTTMYTPYVDRAFRVTPGAWVPLDLGRKILPEHVGYVYAENRTRLPLNVQVTEEQRRALSEQILEIRVGDAVFTAAPGHFFIAEPTDPSSIAFRSRSGILSVTSIVFPR